MKMVHVYHITLHEDADEKAFVTHMTENAFRIGNVVHSLRAVRDVDQQLLKKAGGVRQFAWVVTTDVMNEIDVDKLKSAGVERNVERLQEGLGNFGAMSGVDTYGEVATLQ